MALKRSCAIRSVPNAKPERESMDWEIFGMAGVPEGGTALDTGLTCTLTCITCLHALHSATAERRWFCFQG
jgi:hypothetical protein